jgi:hypothetical protein
MSKRVSSWWPYLQAVVWGIGILEVLILSLEENENAVGSETNSGSKASSKRSPRKNRTRKQLVKGDEAVGVRKRKNG